MVKSLDCLDFFVCKFVTLRVVGYFWGTAAKKLELKLRSAAQLSYERFKKDMSCDMKKKDCKIGKSDQKNEECYTR